MQTLAAESDQIDARQKDSPSRVILSPRLQDKRSLPWTGPSSPSRTVKTPRLQQYVRPRNPQKVQRAPLAEIEIPPQSSKVAILLQPPTQDNERYQHVSRPEALRCFRGTPLVQRSLAALPDSSIRGLELSANAPQQDNGSLRPSFTSEDIVPLGTPASPLSHNTAGKRSAPAPRGFAQSPSNAPHENAPRPQHQFQGMPPQMPPQTRGSFVSPNLPSIQTASIEKGATVWNTACHSAPDRYSHDTSTSHDLPLPFNPLQNWGSGSNEKVSHPQSFPHADPAPPHPSIPPAMSPPFDLLLSISQCLAFLENSKVLNILATAAMHHQDIYDAIRREHEQVYISRRATQDALLEHLVGQSQVASRAADLERNRIIADLRQRVHAAQSAYGMQTDQQVHAPDVALEAPSESGTVLESSEPDSSVPETGALDFTKYVGRVSYILYGKYGSMRDSEQTFHIYDAVSDIEKAITGIADRVQPQSFQGTKLNALEALSNIGLHLIEGNGYLPSKVANSLGYGDELVDALKAVYETMSISDKKTTLGDKELMDTLESLDNKRMAVFEGFGEFLQKLKGEGVRVV